MSSSVREQVFRWCQEEKVFKEELKDEMSAFHFHVTARTNAKNSSDAPDLSIVNIVQPAAEPDKLIVSGGITLDPGFIASMKKVPDFDQVIFDLNMAMESRPESYFIEYGSGAIKSIVVIDEIFFDGLTKDRLFRSIRGVNKGVMVALWVLRPLLEAMGGNADELIGLEEPAPAALTRQATPPVTNNVISGPPAKPKNIENLEPRYCPACGKANPTLAKYCTGCGRPLTGR